jgi:predicted secreted protein
MFKVARGEPFTVDLRCSPSTGYRWEGPSATGDVELLKHEFVVPVDAQPGDSSVQRFHLLTHTSGRHDLTFTLKRSWEQEGVDTHVILVEVE